MEDVDFWSATDERQGRIDDNDSNQQNRRLQVLGQGLVGGEHVVGGKIGLGWPNGIGKRHD